MIVTVRGPLDSSSLGRTLVHEHVLVDFSAMDITSRDKYDTDDVIEKVTPFLEDLQRFGFTGFVDCTPSYLGRDIRLLYKLSERLDMHIITNTGYYGAANDRYVPKFAYEEREEKLANRWIKEYRDGIEDTGIRPGFIKIGVDPGPLSEIDRKLVSASAMTHLETGLTIACHTGEGEAALDVLNVIKSYKVSPSALIIVHADSIKDRDVIFKLADEGCWVELDSVGSKPIETHLELIGEVIKRNFISQLLISQDAGWYRVEEPDGGMNKFNPYIHIPEILIPALVRDISEDIINIIFIENPTRALSISGRKLCS